MHAPAAAISCSTTVQLNITYACTSSCSLVLNYSSAQHLLRMHQQRLPRAQLQFSSTSPTHAPAAAPSCSTTVQLNISYACTNSGVHVCPSCSTTVQLNISYSCTSSGVHVCPSCSTTTVVDVIIGTPISVGKLFCRYFSELINDSDSRHQTISICSTSRMEYNTALYFCCDM